MKKGVIKQLISSAYFSGVISLITSLSAIIWIPSALSIIGVDEYSKYVKFSIFFYTGLAGVLLLGYQSTALKFSADFWFKHPQKIKALYSFLVKKLIFKVIVILLIILIFSKFLFPYIGLFEKDYYLFATVLFFLPLQFLNLVNINFLNGRKEFRLTQRIIFIQETTKLILILILIRIYESYQVVIYAFLTSQVIGLIFTSIHLYKKVKNITKVNLDERELLEIGSFQKQLSSQGIISSIYNNSDKVIGSILLTSSALGALDIILKLPQLFHKLIFTTVSGIIPVIGPEKENVDKYYKEGLHIFSLLCLGFSLITYFQSDFIYKIWLGQSFDQEYSRISSNFVFWIALLPIIFPGSILISKNYKVGSTTLFRLSQAIIKGLSLTLAFIFFNIHLVPYAYIISLLPGIILFKPLKNFGVRYSESIIIYVRSIMWVTPMIMINFIPLSEILLLIIQILLFGTVVGYKLYTLLNNKFK